MKKHLAFLWVLLPVFLYGAVSEKNGLWNDPDTWKGKMVPGNGEEVKIMSTVVIDGTVKCGKLILMQETMTTPPGIIHFAGDIGSIDFSCDSLLVFASAEMHIVTDVNTKIRCGGIRVYPEGFSYRPIPEGLFISETQGLDFACQGIYNEGTFRIITSNNIHISGDIVVGSDIKYTGNGINYTGNLIKQIADGAVFNVSQLNFQATNNLPLRIGGNLHLKNTRFYLENKMMKPLSKEGDKVLFDGGYVVDGYMDSITMDNKNGFYMSGVKTTNTNFGGVTTILDLTLLDNNTISGVLVPKDFGTEYGVSAKLVSMGTLTNHGIIKDSTLQLLTMNYTGSLINHGEIRLEGAIIGYKSPELINHHEIKCHGITMNKSDFGFDVPEDHKYINGPESLINNGLISSLVYMDTIYTISTANSGYWEGDLMGCGYYEPDLKSFIEGTHHFSYGERVFGLKAVKEAVLIGNKIGFQNIAGENIRLNVKSGCYIDNVRNCDIFASGKLKLMGVNSGKLEAADTLLFDGSWSGSTYSNPHFEGRLITRGLVMNAPFSNAGFSFGGEWVNLGLFTSESYLGIKGTLVNNGTISANGTVDGGNIIQNGSWTERTWVVNNMRNNKSNFVWMIKPQAVGIQFRMNNDYPFDYALTRNGVAVTQMLLDGIQVSDTGKYVVKSKPAGSYESTTRIALKTPYACIAPVSDFIFSPEKQFRWNRIPGATAYRLRITYLSDTNNQEIEFLTDTIVSDTVLTVSGMGKFIYHAYLSARYGSENNYTWSQESYPHAFDNGRFTGIDAMNTSQLKLYPTAVNAGEVITLSGLKPGNTKLICTDLSGREVGVLFDGRTDGILQVNMPGSLRTGFYLVRAACETETLVGKIRVY